MRENVAELVLHPVRLRILQAFIGGRTLAAEDLDAELGDVPKATLYRQLATLAEAGILAVVEERPARGTPRRIYALVEGAASIAPDDLATATPEDHLRFFTVFWATVLGDVARYLGAGRVDFAADGAGYRQVGLELTDAELAELAGRINAAIAPVLANRPAPGRRRRVLSTVLVPRPV